ncbi:cilia- and flagella-associated protein 337-like [Enoplosus armatus]|uniref:cilia- and flagella-associated protein 337-like n=1 Tax=Enoplosus armatus TaxID=215367 RepID=UPI00399327AC
MERHTEIAKDLPEDTPMDTGSEPKKENKMFSAGDIPAIVKLFKEADADGGGGLDMEEFCVAIKNIYGTLDKEEIIILHMQIDTNCDYTVDCRELMEFLLNKNKAAKTMDYKNQPFPKPIKRIPVDHYKTIIRLFFRPHNDGRKPNSEVTGQTRTYQRGQYLSISSDGILNFWNDNFNITCTIALNKTQKTLPFSHLKNIHINDVVYLPELQELAVCTSDRKVSFYKCEAFPDTFRMSHSLIVEDEIVNAMNYWSDGTKAVFSFGDVKGFLSLFISNDIKIHGLFGQDMYEKISLHMCKTVYVSKLLKQNTKEFQCLKVKIFQDICSQVSYLSSLEAFAICGSSSKEMVLAVLMASPRTKVLKRVFKSIKDKEYFTCVEYFPSVRRLVTGGTDGLLRVWFPHRSTSCEQELVGHVKPVTHIMFNPEDKIFISLSEDKHLRVWSVDGWVCRQSFQVQDMGPAPITSVCYNTQNNELLLANSDMGKYLGRATDLFKDTLTSHDKPLCCALYHSIFKQVISVCQNGMVTVWDILTGKAIMQFKSTPDQHVGLTTMAFDGLRRRLITVSRDGKVRLWNFNNGSQLAVLPVTLPTEVTGIVCINNRVFVSSRNSKKIFDLDLEEEEYKFLEHDYLNDISSIDVHDDTLITASSNGNIVIWNTNNSEVLYWFNASKSPRMQMADKRAQGRTGSLPVEKTQKNVRDTQRNPPHNPQPPQTGNETDVTVSPLVICLNTRVVTVNTAALLTSADGYICAWSVISKGGLFRKFRAVSDEGAIVTTMSTDANEDILLCGDSTGKIYMWDIRRFGFKKDADEGPFENVDGWRVSLCPPPLLASWQSHSTAVVSVKCDPACKNIITAGLDNNVGLWTNTGRCVGLFGKDQWDAPQLSRKEDADQEQTGTAETTNSEKQFSESPRSSSCTSQFTDFEYFHKLIEKAQKLAPKKRTTGRNMLHPVNEKDKNSTQQSPSEVQQQFENTSTSCPPHPPQTPLIRGETDCKQSCLQTASPYLKQTRSKYGRVLKIQQRDILKGSVLTPCPPNTLPGKQGSDHTPKHVNPSIPDKVQLTHQTQLKPHPPQTTCTTGRTNLMKNSPHVQLSARFSSQIIRPNSSHRTHQTMLTAGRTNATKRPPRFSREDIKR